MPKIVDLPDPDDSLSIDISKRYDIYCRGPYPKQTVYRNVLIKGKKFLLKKRQYDSFSEFLEIELANGQIVFIAHAEVTRLCEAGGEIHGEMVE